jgi:glycosyltransferase involved in cell wall biosynthesis
MRIGIDARFLTHPQVGGFKTYTENLLTALSQVDQVNEYILYLDREADTTLPQASNFSYQIVKAASPYLGMPLREQVLLRRRIAQDKLDLVHFLCNTAPVALHHPYVVTLHDTIQVAEQQPFTVGRPLAEQKRWLVTAYSKWSILNSVRNAQRIITVSHYEKQQIERQLQVAGQRIAVTHLAANPLYRQACPEARQQWRIAMSQDHRLERKFILGVGYEPRKNIALLIKAFAQLAPTHPELDLVVVAAQEQARLGFQQLAAELGLAERAIFLASQPPERLAMLYNLAEAFVYPSERESFGLPPLEALACGAPTLAMNLTSLPEILRDGAILIDGKEPATWAAAIERVLVDENLRTALEQRGLAQARRLSWQRCAQGTVAVYEAVLGPATLRGYEHANFA